MADAKFTPGPWVTEDGDSVVSIFSGDVRVAVTASKAYWQRHDETDKANAHLIAAAPDGYEFAEAHEAYMLDLGYAGPDDPSLDETCAEIWRKQRAFRAKARGEQVPA